MKRTLFFAVAALIALSSIPAQTSSSQAKSFSGSLVQTEKPKDLRATWEPSTSVEDPMMQRYHKRPFRALPVYSVLVSYT